MQKKFSKIKKYFLKGTVRLTVFPLKSVLKKAREVRKC